MTLSNQHNQQATSETTPTDAESDSEMQRLYFLPFAIQLQNIFLVEINARRFPLKIAHAPTVQLSTTEIQLDTEHLQAQAILELSAGFSAEHQPFEISSKLFV